MKKVYLILAAAVGMTITSCTTNDYLGDVNNDQAINDGSIQFGTNFKTLTRANAVGADAATKLGNRFVVGGFKTANDGGAYTTIFKDYSVEWAASTAGTTESNTSDWEYVGKTKSVLNTSGDFVQAIKYWDYSDDGTPAHAWYDFIAYSTHMTAANEVTSYAADKVAVSAIDHTKLEDDTYGCYTLEADRDELLNCYVADLVRVPKTDFGKEVTMQFRSLTSKVRVALYETVPGYSVTNVKFYTAHPSTLGSGSTTTSALIGAFGNKAKYAVYFPSTDSYKAHVKIVSHTDDSYANFGTVITGQLEGAEKLETGGTVYLGRSSNDASYYGAESPFFVQVLPNEEGGALELAVDYDLVPIDGTDGVIHVYGATAHIPATYTKWLANYAYTYIFKISDNSNGWTSTVNTDPAGLFPITFDAIVLDSEEKEQKTITTVALPSITTYQKGHNLTKNEYSVATSNKLYAQVYWEGASPALRADLNSKGHLYTVTTAGAEISEATVMDALNIIESGTTGRNKITLTDATASVSYTNVEIPLEDGNTLAVTDGEAAEITLTAPGSGTTKYYAYVYDTGTYSGAYYTAAPADIATANKYYSDPECSSNVTSWTSACYLYQKDPTFIYSATVVTAGDATGWPTGWYTDPDGKNLAPAWVDDNVGKTFYKKYTVNHKVYGVKVIKVVE